MGFELILQAASKLREFAPENKEIWQNFKKARQLYFKFFHENNIATL
jgi:hypothetical protein